MYVYFLKKKIASIILFVVVHPRHNCDASVGFEPSLLSGHMNLYIFWEEKLKTSILVCSQKKKEFFFQIEFGILLPIFSMF